MFATLTENSNDESEDGIRIHGTEDHIRELHTIAGEGEVSHEYTATLRCDPLDTPDSAVCVIFHASPVGYSGATGGMKYMRRYGERTRNYRAAFSCKASEPWRLDVRLDLTLPPR